MTSSASEIFCCGRIVMGSTIIPLSERLTLSTSPAWSSIERFLWLTPSPPICAIAMARRDAGADAMAAEAGAHAAAPHRRAGGPHTRPRLIGARATTGRRWDPVWEFPSTHESLLFSSTTRAESGTGRYSRAALRAGARDLQLGAAVHAEAR